MTQRLSRFFAVAALILTSACSTVVEGPSQRITINSAPQGAECMLKQADKVVARVITPDTASVDKTKNDLVISCYKQGYEAASFTNKSDIAIASLGNMVFGQFSFIGNAVDAASGANNKYSSEVTVNLAAAAAPAAFPAPPGAPKIIRLSTEVAAEMSMQAPMPEAPLTPLPRAIAAPVAPVVATSLPPANPAAHLMRAASTPSLSAAAAFAKAGNAFTATATPAPVTYAEASATAPLRPPFDVAP